MSNSGGAVAEQDPSAPRKDAPQNSVTFVYQAKIAESNRSVTVTWSKNPTNHSLCISVDNSPAGGNRCTCKIDFKSWQFWGKKGLKSFEVDGKRIDVFWDLRQAKFASSSEACSDYYVALVYDQEIVLLLGDLKMEACKRTRSKPSEQEATLLYKKENVCGKKVFCTRAMLEYDGRHDYDVVIESSLSGPDDPEMWITINGMTALRIVNLNWRFRGNESVVVNDLPVQIFWDVHDWLFGNADPCQGLFIFKLEESLSDGHHCHDQKKGNCGGDYYAQNHNEGAIENGQAVDNLLTLGFCHILCAWKTE